jgi:hypothetical protein
MRDHPELGRFITGALRIPQNVYAPGTQPFLASSTIRLQNDPMLRLRLIRSAFIILCVLCAVEWVGSYWMGVGLLYTRKSSGWDFIVMSCGGKITVGFVPGSAYESRTWHLEIGLKEDATWLNVISDNRYELTQFHVIGFSCDPSDRWLVQIPLWFTTTLSIFLLWFVCRKEVPKTRGKAFPIEPTRTI